MKLLSTLLVLMCTASIVQAALPRFVSSAATKPRTVSIEKAVVQQVTPFRGGALSKLHVELPPAVKLLIGAGGIYASFMFYGLLQEGVFSYTSKDGGRFSEVWFLMVLESLANVIIGFLGKS